MKKFLLLLVLLTQTVSAQNIGKLYISGKKIGQFTASGGCTISTSGTREPVPNSTITDTSCNVWTMGTGTTPSIQILFNGSMYGGSYFGAQILFYNNVVYVQGDDLQWYSFTGGVYTGGVGPADPQTGALPDPGTDCNLALSTSVVPCAYGYGMSTRAAYGSTTPTIYRITTVADDATNTVNGDGTHNSSFRVALEASGPRVVIFERSGNIDLTSVINVANPYITVAGQTAPSPGITIRYYGIQIRTHDWLFQHIRIRPGWLGPGTINCNDAIGSYPNANLGVLDHVSASWGQDENMYWYPGAAGADANITIWRSITSESLHRTPGSITCTGALEDGHGMLITQNVTKVSVIQTLFAHNFVRNPYGQNGTGVSLLNNIIYNWSRENGIDFECYTALGPAPWHVSAIGNRFIRGPNTTTGGNAYQFYYSCDYAELNNQIYRSDNTVANNNGSVLDEDNLLSYNPNVGSTPTNALTPSGYTVIASTALESFLLSRVGARPADRDAVDTRVLQTVVNRNYSISGFPETQADVGGWPTLAVNSRSLTIPSTPHATGTSGFYTRLEEWLAGYAATVEAPTAP